jgi:hypothetical protein
MLVPLLHQFSIVQPLSKESESDASPSSPKAGMVGLILPNGVCA